MSIQPRIPDLAKIFAVPDSIKEMRDKYSARLDAGELFQDLHDEINGQILPSIQDRIMRHHLIRTSDILRERALAKLARFGRSRSTEAQYIRWHGRADQVLNQILNHNVDRRENITRYDLEDLWDQQGGRCKLTNIPMTLSKVYGRPAPLNPSIDCIVPKSEPGSPGYAKGNVRLVCDVINSFRKTLPDATMHMVFRKIVEHYPIADEASQLVEVPRSEVPAGP